MLTHAEASFSWRSLEGEWSKDAAMPDERWGGSLTCTQPDQVRHDSHTLTRCTLECLPALSCMLPVFTWPDMVRCQ